MNSILILSAWIFGIATKCSNTPIKSKCDCGIDIYERKHGWCYCYLDNEKKHLNHKRFYNHGVQINEEIAYTLGGDMYYYQFYDTQGRLIYNRTYLDFNDPWNFKEYGDKFIQSRIDSTKEIGQLKVYCASPPRTSNRVFLYSNNKKGQAFLKINSYINSIKIDNNFQRADSIGIIIEFYEEYNKDTTKIFKRIPFI